MGYLLKEALKTLCGVNQWSYAVFWKIAVQNPKLLIWEECYYESDKPSIPQSVSESKNCELPFGEWEGSWVSTENRSCQLSSKGGNGVHSLIGRMILDNQVNVVGEGVVGRAAFTGNFLWIHSNNYITQAQPPEVLNELHQQFAAGIQTVAVIPVLPHGVVQLGSSLAIMENVGFVNDAKSLILHLGCIPGALLSDSYSTKESGERIGIPVSLGRPVSVDAAGYHQEIRSSSLMIDNHSQQHSLSSSAGFVGPSSHSLAQNQDNLNTSAPVCEAPPMVETRSKSNIRNNPAKAVMEVNSNSLYRSRVQNGVLGAEMTSSNPDAWLNRHASLYSSSLGNSYQLNNGFGQSNPKPLGEGILPNSVLPPQANSTTSSIDNFVAPQLKADGVLNSCRPFSRSPPISGTILQSETSTHLRPNASASSEIDPFRAADVKYSCSNAVGSVTRAVVLPDKADKLATISSISGSSGAIYTKHDQNEFELFQALNMQLANQGKHTSLGMQIPTSVPNFQSVDNRDLTTSSSNAVYEGVNANPASGDDLFDILGAEFRNKLANCNMNSFAKKEPEVSPNNFDKSFLGFVNEHDVGSSLHSLNEGIVDSGIFSGFGADNLLDAVVSRAQPTANHCSDDNLSCRTTLTKISSSSVLSSTPTYTQTNMSDRPQGELFNLSKLLSGGGASASSSFMSGCSNENAGNCSQASSLYGSQISSWVEQGHNVKRENSVSTAFSKRSDQKSNRKRLKPGENPRPRPKDRQMIQDRVKELREIVPNGAKCSIDSLLERTIKHMLFLQSVTKHADKLKQTGEPKIINKEGALVLKDNFEGGATWAYEVGSNSTVCPIIVEDLNPPRQMLVEMLCEERGFFLEIADLIRGMGMTILKGVMEFRNDKIWGRFAVEANRDVTRVEVFMSLVRLLEQTVKGSTSSAVNDIDNDMMVQHSFPQAASVPVTSQHNNLQ